MDQEAEVAQAVVMIELKKERINLLISERLNLKALSLLGVAGTNY